MALNKLIGIDPFKIGGTSKDPKLKVAGIALDCPVEIVKVGEEETFTYPEAINFIQSLPAELLLLSSPQKGGTRKRMVAIGETLKEKLLCLLGSHFSAEQYAYVKMLPRLREVLQESFLIEEHRDRMKNANGKRFPNNLSCPEVEKIQRWYGAVGLGNTLYRVKTTIRVLRREIGMARLYSYEVVKIDLQPLKKEINEEESTVTLNELMDEVELSFESGVKVIDAIAYANYIGQGVEEARREKLTKERERKALINSLKADYLCRKAIASEDASVSKREEWFNLSREIFKELYSWKNYL